MLLTPMATPRTGMQLGSEAFSRIGETRKVWQYDQDMDKLGPLLFPAPQVSAWMPPSLPPYMSSSATASFRNVPYTPSAISKVGAAKNPQYKAPAHKHAHHLHSIPPREKSTRTLIIDHMLWVHGRSPNHKFRVQVFYGFTRQDEIRPGAG
jgi:hypothetical protein